jgi:hypothetical protein
MDGETSAALRQIRLALRRLLGERLQFAEPSESHNGAPRLEAAAAAEPVGLREDSKRSEAKASTG